MLPGGGPLGGHILSHDQIEAALMRRAGYEVRVLPIDGVSWEENPPSSIDFVRRDLRWCQGNMQYWQLMNMPGLKTVSRSFRHKAGLTRSLTGREARIPLPAELADRWSARHRAL